MSHEGTSAPKRSPRQQAWDAFEQENVGSDVPAGLVVRAFNFAYDEGRKLALHLAVTDGMVERGAIALRRAQFETCGCAPPDEEPGREEALREINEQARAVLTAALGEPDA